MIDPGIAKFLACYVDTLQIIPSEMQTAITAYLQSDLQHQHLLRLCRESITELTSTTAADDQKKALRKLVYSLIAIQDICDRRITTVDELQQLLENHTQTLLACRNDLTSSASCLGTSSVDNVSEIEAYENQDDETKGAVNLALLRQASDDRNQRLEVDGAGSVSHTDVKLKGKTRLSMRPGARVSRSTNSRRPLNRWDNGTHRRKARPSPVGVNKGALLGLKHRRATDARLTERLGTDHRERKLNMPYPRYARTQQRLKNQQRILSRALHPTHSRLLQYPNSSQRSTQAKGRDGRMLLSVDDRVGSKGARLLASGQRMDNHVEWIHSERYYPEHSADLHIRSLSNNSSDEDRRESDDNGARSPEISRRITDTGARNWIKEEPAILEDMEDSDSMEDITVDESSATTQDTKPYIGLEQRQRLSSPCIHGRVSHTGSRRLSRHRKTTDDSSKSEQAVCRSVSPLDHNLTAFSSSGNNGNTTNRRRDRTVTPVRSKQDTRQNPRQSPENSSKHTSPSDLSIGGGGRHRNPAGSRSPAERPVNVNGSPDERLYCLCKKVSFGDMIACDNKSCKVEWFHFGCVDIRTQPKGKWYCPNCRGESSKIKRADL